MYIAITNTKIHVCRSIILSQTLSSFLLYSSSIRIVYQYDSNFEMIPWSSTIPFLLPIWHEITSFGRIIKHIGTYHWTRHDLCKSELAYGMINTRSLERIILKERYIVSVGYLTHIDTTNPCNLAYRFDRCRIDCT